MDCKSHIVLSTPSVNVNPYFGITEGDLDNYLLARCYVECGKYERAAQLTLNCESAVSKFVLLYAMYLALEKKKLDNMVDSSGIHGVTHLEERIQ